MVRRFFDKLTGAFTTASQDDGLDISSILTAADQANHNRDWKQALALYGEVLDARPELGHIWVQYGHCLKETGDIAAAIAAYRKALELEPQASDTHLQLGHALKLSGNLDGALNSYRRAVECDPLLKDAATEIVIVEHMLASMGRNASVRHPDAPLIEPHFDTTFYVSGFPHECTPLDPASHYLSVGWREGRNPAPWFSTHHYLALNPDVAAAGVNPFLHYVVQGRSEVRRLFADGRKPDSDVYAAHQFAVSAGPHFEEFDATLGIGRRKRAKVLAYYLPQFHAEPVNDEHWGKGFTEWRNLPRGLPRYQGHVQPRIPRDLGCYDLSEGDALRRQIDMAKAGGIHGFCFYHYWFDGRRVLDAPMERLLADPTLDMPFCIMWANENWTRTWDGAEKEVILKQTYDPADDEAFVADLARHMRDSRYIRLDGRPLMFIYRPGHIPEPQDALARWRRIFSDRHNLNPLIFQAQAFGDNDPGAFDLDGAIEFPPHKVLNNVPEVNFDYALLGAFEGSVRRYDDVVAAAKADKHPDFPLIRTVFPGWDNDARRPGRSTIISENTPAKFATWLNWAIDDARRYPVYGEALVCINAWNEWAEGAYLEPDVHFGGAFLNEVSRAVYGVGAEDAKQQKRILLVGHDPLAFGAQRLLAALAQEFRASFGYKVSFLLMAGDDYEGAHGSMLKTYATLGDVEIMGADPAEVERQLAGLRAKGVEIALTNTTATGALVESLKENGFTVLSLIHELPSLLKSYQLEAAASAIAAHSDHVIFPAEVVRRGFEDFAGRAVQHGEILPQGLYNTSVLNASRNGGALRAELGLPAEARIVLGVGYADLRKGIDRFVTAALALCSRDPSFVFLWVGSAANEAKDWFEPEIRASGLSDRIRILGHRDDVARFYALADVFYLSSREDPFPSVVLEALACGLPVVGYKGCGGCDDLIARHGALVDSADPSAVVNAISEILARPERARTAAARRRRDEIASSYQFEDYAFALLQRLMPDLASVSVVVPNYNYEAYIGPRLHSVFEQNYPLREIIVLDDASKDASVSVIRATAEAAGRTISLHVNEGNSGSPFAQWRKGAEMARGEYVWIAEADDLADPSLVSALVERMQQSGAALGFCDSAQIDEKDARIGESYKPYVNEIEAGAFDRAFDMEGPEFLARYLSVKNVILNVSAVVFRRQALLDALKAVGPELFDYRVAGDWRLYTELCARGGNVSYLPTPMNIHRRHSVSVTHALNVERHLSEIGRMHKTVSNLATLDVRREKLQIVHFQSCLQQLTAGARGILTEHDGR